MFKRSMLLVLVILAVVFGSAFATQMALTSDLPSSYDSGRTLDDAFKTSQVPLLIEFYSDTCSTCQRVAPIVHDLEADFDNRLTLVMLDIDKSENMEIAQLFGVEELPGLYVFDFKHMKKYQVDIEDMGSKGTLRQALDEVLAKAMLRAG